jgi:hypothetical protein
MRLRFNKVMKVKVSHDIQSAVETAARRDHATVSDFIRRVMIDRLRIDGLLTPIPNRTEHGQLKGSGA